MVRGIDFDFRTGSILPCLAQDARMRRRLGIVILADRDEIVRIVLEDTVRAGFAVGDEAAAMEARSWMLSAS